MKVGVKGQGQNKVGKVAFSVFFLFQIIFLRKSPSYVRRTVICMHFSL